MKVRHLTVYFFAFTASLYLYVEKPSFDFEAPIEEPVTEAMLFEQTVQEWSVELSNNIPKPKDVDGNCLPVAMELQKRIVETGRIAFVAVVDPEELEGRHAVVVYSSEVNGRLDSVIDNGYSTYNKVVPKDFLDTGVFGEYVGTCKDPDPSQGLCNHIGLAW
jgi:hypothetical protein